MVETAAKCYGVERNTRRGEPDMNQEIDAVLERIKEQGSHGVMIGHEADQKRLAIDIASLLVLLAEEAEAQGRRAEEQADKVIGLTKALKIFTIVLVAVGVVQIALMTYPLLKSVLGLSM